MTSKEYYDWLLEQKTRSNRYAREVIKEAKSRDIDVPTLISSLASEWATMCEIAAERELMRERY